MFPLFFTVTFMFSHTFSRQQDWLDDNRAVRYNSDNMHRSSGGLRIRRRLRSRLC
ncbi:hypothetical protein PF011_g12668 [Phytophthora fragariae]|uniref:Uncharacterized protein n=1 Tax=Phytophthora fragariae TaxID=53985 RepID=A0A6A3KE28_9STRA|nr:hypothetical protein PF011_g12668 [Phytophthora fragariae]